MVVVHKGQRKSNWRSCERKVHMDILVVEDFSNHPRSFLVFAIKPFGPF